MFKRISSVFISILLVFAAAANTSTAGHESTSEFSAPPKTPVNEVKEVVQGVEIIDPYRWLEDQNSPETRSWIDAQNAYTESLLSKVAGREKIKQRLNSLLKIDAMGTPAVRNGRYFFSRRLANQDQGSICMRNGLQGKDEVLIDPL